MAENLLEIKDLHVNAEDKEILKGINLNINKGEIHVIMGPNGSGKTTTANAILNNPEYTKTSGSIIFDGENINESILKMIKSYQLACQNHTHNGKAQKQLKMRLLIILTCHLITACYYTLQLIYGKKEPIHLMNEEKLPIEQTYGVLLIVHF